MHSFVKWAGGKRQLLDKLTNYMPLKYNKYFEPFVGGGALLFKIQPNNFVINDFNSELIQTYKCFTNKNDFDDFKKMLNYHQNNHSEEYYYKIRAMDKEDDFKNLPIYERAARMLYLNKACFNGLYRVNKKGYFNVPFGKKENIVCYEENNFIELYNYFTTNKCKILNGDFQIVVKNANKNDFVYFDPPYDTLDDKESFTSYVKNPFGKEEQIRLANVFKKLTDKGVYVMLSNHNTKLIQNLYKNYKIHVVPAKRMINSDASKRGCVEEVIITNYEN